MTTVRVDTRLKDWDRSELRGKVCTLIRKRKLLVPCPWSDDPYGAYMSLFPVEVKAAMEAIAGGYGEKFKHILNYESSAEVHLSVHHGKRVTFNFGREMPAVPPAWKTDSPIKIKPAHPMYEHLEAFANACIQCDKEIAAVSDLVEHITFFCNTYGQIHRVWPDLLPTIGGTKVQAAENQKRKSSLPWQLETDRIMAHREEYTLWLAQGALLPQHEIKSWAKS